MPGLKLGTLTVHLRAEGRQYFETMGRATRALQSASAHMSRLASTLWFRVTLPIAGVGIAAAKSFATFDDAMTQSLSIMENVSKGMERDMRDLALSLSQQTGRAAAESARSYYYLASAGLDAKQSIEALPVVTKFATAGMFDMADATWLLAGSQGALGMRFKDSRQNMAAMLQISDELIKANTLANATTRQFAEALGTQAGAAMKAFNIPLEEGLGVLAAYADQMIVGADAGVMFSRMIRLMTRGFDRQRDAWRKYGLDIYRSNGELRSMVEIIRDLTEVLGNLSTEQRTAMLWQLGFEARSQQALLPLLKRADALERYTKALKESGGYTQRVYEKQLRSFGVQMRIVWQNIKNAGIAIGEVLAPGLRSLGGRIKEITTWFKGLDESSQLFAVRMAAIVAAAGPIMKGLLALKGAIFALASPFFAAIAVVYLFRIVWKENIFEIKDYWFSFVDDIKEYWGKGWDWIVARAKKAFKALGIEIPKERTAGEWVTQILSWVAKPALWAHKTMLRSIPAMSAALGGKTDFSKSLWGNTKDAAARFMKEWKEWGNILDNLGSILKDKVVGTSKDAVTKIKDTAKDIWGALTSPDVQAEIKAEIEKLLKGMKEDIKSGVESISKMFWGIFGEKPKEPQSWMKTPWGLAKEFGKRIWEEGKKWYKEGMPLPIGKAEEEGTREVGRAGATLAQQLQEALRTVTGTAYQVFSPSLVGAGAYMGPSPSERIQQEQLREMKKQTKYQQEMSEKMEPIE